MDSATYIETNIKRLVDTRIHEFDSHRKRWLLEQSRVLKPRGQTLLPFPDFNSGMGRSISDSDTEVLTYTRSDALNMLMAYAGNDNPGLMGGALLEEVKSKPELVEKIGRLCSVLENEPPIESIEDERIFINELSVLKVDLPSDTTNGEVIKDKLHVKRDAMSGGDTIDKDIVAEGMVVDIDTALKAVSQIVDQLLEPNGLKGAFYDAEDASYLGQMLSEFIN